MQTLSDILKTHATQIDALLAEYEPATVLPTAPYSIEITDDLPGNTCARIYGANGGIISIFIIEPK